MLICLCGATPAWCASNWAATTTPYRVGAVLRAFSASNLPLQQSRSRNDRSSTELVPKNLRLRADLTVIVLRSLKPSDDVALLVPVRHGRVQHVRRLGNVIVEFSAGTATAAKVQRAMAILGTQR